MRRLPASIMSGWLLCLALPGMAAAQEQAAAPADIPAHDVVPSKAQQGVVHINAISKPEMHAYRAIVAGLDKFDQLHAMAPKVPRLVFVARSRGNGGAPLTGAAPTARLSADGFSLPLPLDDTLHFTVPRNQQAWDSKAELVMSRKRREVMVWPDIRTPGLLENQRRLGDVRLECQVLIAVAKEEAPFYIVAMVNTLILTTDWCSFMKDKDRTWSVAMPSKLASATLRDGERSMALRVSGRQFHVPIGDSSLSDDALIEVAYAPEEAGAADAAAIRTAGETPRTGP